MKFYCKGLLLNKVEDQEYELLCGVRLNVYKRGSITKDNWGSGWIYESDESFRSWCAIAYGFEPVIITEQEFYLLNVDGVAFLSRERTEEIRSSLNSQILLIQKIRNR